MLAVRAMRPATAVKRARARAGDLGPFTPATPPPGIVPKNTKAARGFLAMDEELSGSFGQLSNWGYADGGADEGIGFLGYAYLAQLTQRPEFRRMSERIATEMTREWIELEVTSNTTPAKVAKKKPAEQPQPGAAEAGAPGAVAQDFAIEPEADQADPIEADPEAAANEYQDKVRAAQKAAADDKTEKLRQLEDELKRLKVKDAFYNAAEQDGWFGRSHIYLELATVRGFASDDREELQTSIGNGRNTTSKSKVRKKSLKAVRNVEPMWAYPARYEAVSPLKSDFYNPEQWFVNGLTVHCSRLLTFVGREVPDILKPAYAFGGLSLSQMAKPYVDNWLRTRQAVAT
jgi:rubrerythrin